MAGRTSARSMHARGNETARPCLCWCQARRAATQARVQRPHGSAAAQCTRPVAINQGRASAADATQRSYNRPVWGQLLVLNTRLFIATIHVSQGFCFPAAAGLLRRGRTARLSRPCPRGALWRRSPTGLCAVRRQPCRCAPNKSIVQQVFERRTSCIFEQRRV